MPGATRSSQRPRVPGSSAGAAGASSEPRRLQNGPALKRQCRSSSVCLLLVEDNETPDLEVDALLLSAGSSHAGWPGDMAALGASRSPARADKNGAEIVVRSSIRQAESRSLSSLAAPQQARAERLRAGSEEPQSFGSGRAALEIPTLALREKRA